MKSYWAFTKKEFIESIRTYKLLIMIVVFLILGTMSPLIAKFTPEILDGMESSSMQVSVMEIGAIDSWTQYYKNVPLIGLILLVIIYSGMLSNEIGKGTLINILTKGMKRTTVIVSKMTVSIIIWTISYILAFAVTYAYTVYYWPDDVLENIVVSALFVWAFGIMILSFIMLGSVIIKGTTGGLLLPGGMLAVMFVGNFFPEFAEYNPMYLVTQNTSLLNEIVELSDFCKPCLVCIALTICSLISACIIFNKRAV